MVGTIGPLVQGSSPRRRRLQVTVLFGTAFLSGAALMFLFLFFAGATAQAGQIPLSLRRSIAAVALLALASVDVWARRSGTYCPVAWKRQTPRRFRLRHSVYVVASIWGFDTGLAVTTFRVTAATWG